MIERFCLRILPLIMLLSVCCMVPGQVASAAPGPVAEGQAMGHAQSSEAVMQHFAGNDEVAPERLIETKRKHQILFIMGISLLVLLLITGSLGIVMAAFDKDVFVPHMIFAGLTITLAVAHAATSIVWFWPY